MWKEADVVQRGYIFGMLAEVRTFRLDDMLASAVQLKDFTEKEMTAYVANYRDRNGEAPKYKGEEIDSFGVSRYQSAPAYKDPSTDSQFRYLPDGTLVQLLERTEQFYKVGISVTDDTYYVPIKYISGLNPVKKLSQVVVIDPNNQNEAVFQYFKDGWQLVSVTYASTCSQNLLLEEGKPAFYKVIDKREKFNYLDDNNENVKGYAPYALRFNGSAYIHGVPVEYKVKDGVASDPGMSEYVFTMGTLPRAKSGIRNYTSHAKFLYDWLLQNESAVIILP